MTTSQSVRSPVDDEPILTVATSSRALFDLEAGNGVYEQQGLEKYREYQIEHEDDPLEAGEAFEFVRKILLLNGRLNRRLVEVILLSHNSADTGLRVFNSIEHHRLGITRAAFCGGESPWRYVRAFDCHLFLSTVEQDVRKALQEGVAAARLLPSPKISPGDDMDDMLRIAFDGDNVLFAGDAEHVYLTQGRDAFEKSEVRQASEALPVGPFKRVLEALHTLQRMFDESEACPIRTALVTARSAPAHKRVIQTLRKWDIRLDECLFLGGQDKAAFLEAFNADIFFDDQQANCDSVAEIGLVGHVPSEAQAVNA
ncbi:MAG: 5'-nucleotidase [Gammaproteobacteria bacterium]|nr:5'-nucleotidase [Gammaproteobacteria bacterium]MCY4198387.1 5'-nucleotidase [Gammaproteobacteria bacterium]MCY4278843.1 5'-nucleotidase [Gammaproteobacteria bacterium]MCY4323835.1 5'-nucleotidase [Gammaproteobacteria bacterium]